MHKKCALKKWSAQILDLRHIDTVKQTWYELQSWNRKICAITSRFWLAWWGSLVGWYFRGKKPNEAWTKLVLFTRILIKIFGEPCTLWKNGLWNTLHYASVRNKWSKVHRCNKVCINRCIWRVCWERAAGSWRVNAEVGMRLNDGCTMFTT